MSRRSWLFLGLLAAAALALLQLVTGGSAPAPVTASDRGGAKTGGKKGRALTADDIPVVATLLAKPATETFTRDRSLFAYAKSPETLAAEQAERDRQAAEAAKAAKDAAERAAERAKQDAADAEARAKAAKEAADMAAKLPPPPPVPPSFPYQYVGTIGPEDDPYAILLGTDRQFRYAKSGDVVDQKFKIENVGVYRIDLSYADPRFADQFAQVSKYDSGPTPSTTSSSPPPAKGR